ncbi:unnamed protein product [Caenorhabditis angaria]|uniref:Uncharacterized protein n=1 Tax=Caenorhabditis angaria TaxID=860376 RepID=A0A9P1IFA6_9PELO|nr:unnamed protein product [Caenorhabditis angaria]
MKESIYEGCAKWKLKKPVLAELKPLEPEESTSSAKQPLTPLDFAFEKIKNEQQLKSLEIVEDMKDDIEEEVEIGEDGNPVVLKSRWDVFAKKVEEEEQKKKKALAVRRKPMAIRTTPKKLDEEEEVDVVGGVEELNLNLKDLAKLSKTDGLLDAPSLPPQRPQNSRFEKQRMRKDLTRVGVLGYRSMKKSAANLKNDDENSDSDEDSSYIRKRPRLCSSPPPPLERQDGEEDVVVGKSKNPTDRILKRFDGVSASQVLKTKYASSQFPTLPLSKKIMEQNKAAQEKTSPNSVVIKKMGGAKSNATSVAPKNLQIPAYSDRPKSITCYTKINEKTTKCVRVSQNINNNNNISSGNVTACQKCAENAYFRVDMANFRFMEDTTSISVRAHLCDQTRVMIARTAFWNREYARKLGERAYGTIWQKPDEVTAQQTGFCSATVRRCIEIANMSMVPKCAERTGVSNNELSSLQTAFSEDAQFCGQKMRNPHILNQYYHLKHGGNDSRVNEMLAKAAAETAQQLLAAPKLTREAEKEPEDGMIIMQEKEKEKEKEKPITTQKPAAKTVSIPSPPPLPSSSSSNPPKPSSQPNSDTLLLLKPAATQPKKRPILRWPGSPSSIPPQNTPKTVVAAQILSAAIANVPPPIFMPQFAAPLLKPRASASASATKKSATSGEKKTRGRPRKVKEADDAESGSKAEKEKRKPNPRRYVRRTGHKIPAGSKSYTASICSGYGQISDRQNSSALH